MSDPAVDTGTSPSTPTLNRGESRVVEYSRARQTITRRIAEAKATIPHIYLQLEVDMDAAEAHREPSEHAGEESPAPTITDLVIQAVARALVDHPRANATYRDGALTLHPRVNVGLAVDTDDGSVTPVITDADRKTLDEIAEARGDLVARARSGRLTPPEQSGATFTVSNLGTFGVTGSQPVVTPGQAAKLAVGSVDDRPVVRNGRIEPGRVMGLNLSCDHRILHGGEAARFLTAIGDRLEHPGDPGE